MAGLYIHIPFCKTRCIYCGFYSTTGKESLKDRYIQAVATELRKRRGYLRGEQVSTVYIGGGTPSQLSAGSLRRLGAAIHDFTGGGVEEFTVECNPNDVSDELCRVLQEIGANRISMGVQTFSDNRLKFLGRRHGAAEILPAMKRLREHGFGNISIDLMFGFPGETLAEWESDIMQALSLCPEHISAYSLMYEEDTPLCRMLEEGRINENSEETSADMYSLLLDRLAAEGYEHYEISNFCKPGRESRHNSSYWDGTKYLGVGAAAHSYDGTSRQWNVSDLEEYITGTETNRPVTEYEEIDEDTRYNDLITTALRTKRGIFIPGLPQRHRDYLMAYAGKAIAAGLLEISANRLRLTRKGLFVSDNVMAELVMA